MSSEDFSSEPVLFTTFTILNERHRVYFRRGSLLWALENGGLESKVVPIRDIISVDYVHDLSCSCKTVAYAGKILGFVYDFVNALYCRKWKEKSIFSDFR